MQTQSKLLRLLNHRDYLTPAVLARELGISLAAVNEQICCLLRSGLPMECVPERGCKLSSDVIFLREDAILNQVDASARAQIGCILVEPSVDSTNSYLRRLPSQASVHGAVCLAESQTTGRGRRGKHWIASPYRNLMMSLGWVYADWPRVLTGLAIAIGIALNDALAEIGATGLGMKWPNDIVHGHQKLGGILIDVSGDSTGPCSLIIGLGINVHMLESDGYLIDQPWTDLANIMGCSVDRNRLAGTCLSHMIEVLSCYQEEGFERYRQRWPEINVLDGREVSVLLHADGDSVRGTVTGLDGSGALIIRKPCGSEMTCYHGEVSVRRR